MYLWQKPGTENGENTQGREEKYGCGFFYVYCNILFIVSIISFQQLKTDFQNTFTFKFSLWR